MPAILLLGWFVQRQAPENTKTPSSDSIKKSDVINFYGEHGKTYNSSFFSFFFFIL
jgi:hypothetical protein